MQAQQRYVSVHDISASIKREVNRRGKRSATGALNTGGSQVDAMSSMSGSLLSTSGGAAFRTARERSPGRRIGDPRAASGTLERQSPSPPPRSPTRGDLSFPRKICFCCIRFVLLRNLYLTGESACRRNGA